MTDQENEELLIRLDERTKAIHEVVERIIQHQEDQNGYIGACIADVKSHETSLILFKWVGGFFATAFLALIGFFINHIKG